MQNIMPFFGNRSRLLQALLLFLTIGAVFSCSKDERPLYFDPQQQREKEDKLIQEYLKSNNVDMSAVTVTNSGLYYEMVEPGTGVKVESGDRAEVHYTGKLLNGTKFDSSVDRGKTFEFMVGAGNVIKGWDEGLKLMRVGEKARLYIPSHLGYGRYPQNGIPGSSVLIFDIEVIGVK